jgi:2'-5' RNA ligase
MGLIDEDPNTAQPNYLRTLKLIEEGYDLKFLLDNKNNNRVIVVCPTLEGWIIATSREVGISLEKFNLPNDPYRLHKHINLNLDKFKQLIMELVDKRSQRIETLKRLLSERE